MLLKFAYHDFLDEKRFMNTTEKNIKNYQQLLGQFIDYCNENGVVNVEDITVLHIKQYLRLYQQRGNKPSTINSKLQRIRSFLNYMVKCKVINENPAKLVEKQRDDIQINVFTDEQIQQMLSYYRRIRQRDKSYFAYRDYMIIVTFLGTGIRRMEAVNLTWHDVDLVSNNISVIGKSRMKETIPITEKLAKELSAYKTFCEQHWGELSEYVFASNTNQQMTGNSMSLVFRYLKEKMNFKNVRLSPHTFRHTFAHRLCISGTSAFAIQKLLRHKSINQTMLYVNMWGQALREENDKHNPLNNMDL